MADSKKYNGSTWEHSLRKLATATDTITTLPVDIYADGNNAMVGLKGNTVQNSTPTPTTPIMPEGTGERTGNLANENDLDLQKWISNSGTISDNPNGTIFKEKIAITTTNYTVKATANKSAVAGIGVAIYNSNDEFIRREHSASSDKTLTFATTTGDNYFKIIVSTRDTSTESLIQSLSIMANEGSTALPYEPYGYKIPISSGSTTTPVYLGEVQTTRKIKKLVFDGTETWYKTSGSRFNYQILSSPPLRSIACVCSHYIGTTITSYASLQDGQCTTSIVASNITRFAVSDDNYTDIDTFKSYLAAQYAAGTPVTIWYVLANETTGIVNEPLMRIGDYADTVSSITVPMITGRDTFDVDTTLKPSEASLSYTGWHDATVQEWDGSQWNE